MINNFVGVGRLTRDVDLRYSASGTAVANFTVAIPRRYDKEKSDFIRCVAFKKTAELMAEYVRKGHQVGIEGSIQTGSYQNKEGQTIYTTDVIVNNVQFLESRASSAQPRTTDQQRIDKANEMVKPSEGQQVDISDSDLPF